MSPEVMLTSRWRLVFALSLSLSRIVFVAGDPVDWVAPQYALRQPARAQSSTEEARQQISTSAKILGKKGPWSVTNTSIPPPNGNKAEYFSWAPYWWPDCQWCGQPNPYRRSQAEHDQPGKQKASAEDADQPYNEDTPRDNQELYDFSVPPLGIASAEVYPTLSELRYKAGRARHLSDHRKMRRVQLLHPNTEGLMHGHHLGAFANVDVAALPNPASTSLLPTTVISDTATNVTPAPAHEAAKKGRTTPTSTCRPSPTSSMSPSATWTTCPYIRRDGKTNPDVKQLTDVNAIGSVTQSVLYNTLAYIFSTNVQSSSTAVNRHKRAKTNTRSNNVPPSTYLKNAVQAIDVFFLNSDTAISPDVSYGQVIRGPGTQVGTFMAILDLRGMVKLTNTVLMLRQLDFASDGSGSSGDLDYAWTIKRDTGMIAWARPYISWLESSKEGGQAAGNSNNHASFFYSQLIALKILVNDLDGARNAVRAYFQGAFQDQFAQSGEQPFEAVRTRPFHYRCFNLEAVITNAKLADFLGLNMWLTHSKYGANIQDAVKYAMSLDPKDEPREELFPHVAAAAAAYGDPSGVYTQYLNTYGGFSGDDDYGSEEYDDDGASTESASGSSYKSKPFWFYDQPESLRGSTASTGSKRWKMLGSRSPEDITRPRAFEGVDEFEMEPGLIIYWDDIRKFYEQAAVFP